MRRVIVAGGTIALIATYGIVQAGWSLSKSLMNSAQSEQSAGALPASPPPETGTLAAAAVTPKDVIAETLARSGRLYRPQDPQWRWHPHQSAPIETPWVSPARSRSTPPVGRALAPSTSRITTSCA